MVRAAERLSARAVQAAKEPGMYADGKSLYLRIGPTGAKSWIFRYRADGRRHDLGLGPYPDIGLADARERATVQRRLRLDGQDPLMVRRTGRDQARLAAAKAMTFKQCAEAYIASHRATWKNPVHAKQWGSTMETYVYPALGDLPVAAVDTSLVMKAIGGDVWAGKPETASRVRGRIESILGWATVSGYRTGDNPARWKGHLENLLPAPSKAKRAVRQAKGRIEHHAALPYAEIAEFIAALGDKDGVGALALEFTILTAARTGEVIGATWGEFNLAERVWTIPAERMKAEREHRVPLSGRALAIVEQMARQKTGEFVFSSGDGPLSNMTMLKMLQRMRPEITVHGFRSSFRDWAAERTSFPSEVVEMALAHAVGDKVEAAYRRGDLLAKRRQLADAWARYCAVREPAAGSKVVSIRS